MRSLVILTMVVLLAPNLVQGQEKEYPYPLKPGVRFRGSADVDTLFWVLKSSQYDKAISGLKEVELLKLKTGKLEAILAKHDSTIAEFKIEKKRLLDKWNEQNKNLEDKEVQVLKLRRWTIFSGLIGIGAGFILGALVL